MSHRTVRTLLVLAASCAALLAFAPGAMARGHRGDRNHDGLPDRWERANRLSLKFNQAKRDQDHDGLRNKAEFLAADNPRDADSDDDGTKDGQEQAGKVVSFTAGILIVHLFNGDDVKGTVDADTEFECKAAPTAVTPISGTARAADDGDGHGGGGDEGDNNNRGHDEGDGDNNDGEHDDGDDDDDNGQAGCDATKLTPGATAGEAELKATAAGLVFEKIELVG